MTLVAALAVGVLVGAGVHAMTGREVVRIIAGSMLLTNGGLLFLISIGAGGRQVPIEPHAPPSTLSDPVVQALTLTAIVIGLGTTILLLRLALALERSHDTLDVERLAELDTEGDDA